MVRINLRFTLMAAGGGRPVARMERSAIRGRDTGEKALHPGYDYCGQRVWWPVSWLADFGCVCPLEPISPHGMGIDDPSAARS
jgi:hypothetical protein